MKNIRIIKVMSVVVCILLFTACTFSNNTPEPEEMEGPIKMPKALFIYNFQYVDKKRVVSYIDEIGDIYMIDLSSEERGFKLKEVNEKLDSSKDKKIGHVDEKQLKKMYELFLQVPIESGSKENLIYTESGSNVEQGYHKWYGFRYNKQGEFEYVLLNGEGESCYENQNETAQKIAEWLKNNIVEYDLNSNWGSWEE